MKLQLHLKYDKHINILFYNFFYSTLTKNENFTIISLNNCFVSIYVIVRLTHDYPDFIADNDYAIVIPISGLFKRQRLKKRIPNVARAQEQVIH